MASAFAHIGSAVVIGAVFFRQALPRRIWCMGHRGFTHSLAFAALWSGFLVAALRYAYGEGGLTLFLYFFLRTVSHGVLARCHDRWGVGGSLLRSME